MVTLLMDTHALEVAFIMVLSISIATRKVQLVALAQYHVSAELMKKQVTIRFWRILIVRLISAHVMLVLAATLLVDLIFYLQRSCKINVL